MSNVRVCVDVVGGDEKPQVVLDGIEAARHILFQLFAEFCDRHI